jgi:hypothetical protein
MEQGKFRRFIEGMTLLDSRDNLGRVGEEGKAVLSATAARRETAVGEGGVIPWVTFRFLGLKAA